MRAFTRLSAQWAVAIVIFIVFLFNWGYFTLFEAFWNGRTPGKRVARIRVIQRSGRAIGLFESMARNLVRYVDQIPFFYAVGVIAMFVTRGSTSGWATWRRARWWCGIASRRRRCGASRARGPLPRAGLCARLLRCRSRMWPVTLPAAGIAKLSAADLEVLEGFFARRLDMPLPHASAWRSGSPPRSRPNPDWSGLPGPAWRHFWRQPARQLRDLARMQVIPHPRLRSCRNLITVYKCV